MKRFLKFSFVLLLITTFGCAGDSVDCKTPPVPFIFEFIDKDTGENLFANGVFDSKNPITITDLETQKIIQSIYIKSDNLHRFTIETIGWKTEKVNYLIQFDNKSIFELHVDAERANGKNCDYTIYKSIEIKNAEFEFDKTTGVYKIHFTQYL